LQGNADFTVRWGWATLFFVLFFFLFCTLLFLFFLFLSVINNSRLLKVNLVLIG
jgi:hypothetical protein